MVYTATTCCTSRICAVNVDRKEGNIMQKSYREELVGVFGDPIDENPTVILEQAAFQACQLNYRYLNILVKSEDLEQAILGMKAMHMKGINLTIPHKCAVLPYLDGISKEASIIGAVNTIVVKDGKLLGENTDGKGFLTSLQENDITVLGQEIMILGAGGAARAIAVELALAGAKKITIVNRSRQRGEELTTLIQEKTSCQAEFLLWNKTISIPEEINILVNATSIGLFPNVEQKPDLDESSLRPDLIVCDVIPNHPRTQLLKMAEQQGAKTIDGLGMLVNQGAINFQLWTGKKAPVEVMKQAIQKEFGLEESL